MGNKIKRDIRFTDDEWWAAQEAADLLGIKRSEFIRRAVQKEVRRQKRESQS